MKWVCTDTSFDKLVLIAGNHDTTVHTSYYERRGRKRFHSRKKEPYDPSKVRDLLTQGKYVHEKRTIEVIYLEDDGAIVENLFFWGSPWQPEFCDWAFNVKRGKECQRVSDLIPDQVQVLLTHGPPLGHGDVTSSGLRVGCEDLMYTTKSRLSNLKVHLFGIALH